MFKNILDYVLSKEEEALGLQIFFTKTLFVIFPTCNTHVVPASCIVLALELIYLNFYKSLTTENCF